MLLRTHALPTACGLPRHTRTTLPGIPLLILSYCRLRQALPVPPHAYHSICSLYWVPSGWTDTGTEPPCYHCLPVMILMPCFHPAFVLPCLAHMHCSHCGPTLLQHRTHTRFTFTHTRGSFFYRCLCADSSCRCSLRLHTAASRTVSSATRREHAAALSCDAAALPYTGDTCRCRYLPLQRDVEILHDLGHRIRRIAAIVRIPVCTRLHRGYAYGCRVHASRSVLPLLLPPHAATAACGSVARVPACSLHCRDSCWVYGDTTRASGTTLPSPLPHCGQVPIYRPHAGGVMPFLLALPSLPTAFILGYPHAQLPTSLPRTSRRACRHHCLPATCPGLPTLPQARTNTLATGVTLASGL